MLEFWKVRPMDRTIAQKENNAPVEIRERVCGVYKRVLILATSVSMLVGVYWTFHFRWFGMMETNGYMYLIISLLLPLVFLIFPVTLLPDRPALQKPVVSGTNS